MKEVICDERTDLVEAQVNRLVLIIVQYALLAAVAYRAGVQRQPFSQYADLAVIAFGSCFLVALLSVIRGAVIPARAKKLTLVIAVGFIIAAGLVLASRLVRALPLGG